MEMKLLRGQICLIDEIDFETYSQQSWGIVDGYVARGSFAEKTTYYLHLEIARRIWTTEQMKGLLVDHKDQNKLNNQRSNLRLATHSENQANRGLHPKNRSGFKGVSWNKNARKWAASIQFQGKRIYLGLYLTKEQAAVAYNLAASKYFGEFAQLNILPEITEGRRN